MSSTSTETRNTVTLTYVRAYKLLRRSHHRHEPRVTIEDYPHPEDKDKPHYALHSQQWLLAQQQARRSRQAKCLFPQSSSCFFSLDSLPPTHTIHCDWHWTVNKLIRKICKQDHVPVCRELRKKTRQRESIEQEVKNQQEQEHAVNNNRVQPVMQSTLMEELMQQQQHQPTQQHETHQEEKEAMTIVVQAPPAVESVAVEGHEKRKRHKSKSKKKVAFHITVTEESKQPQPSPLNAAPSESKNRSHGHGHSHSHKHSHTHGHRHSHEHKHKPPSSPHPVGRGLLAPPSHPPAPIPPPPPPTHTPSNDFSFSTIQEPQQQEQQQQPTPARQPRHLRKDSSQALEIMISPPPDALLAASTAFQPSEESEEIQMHMGERRRSTTLLVSSGIGLNADGNHVFNTDYEPEISRSLSHQPDEEFKTEEDNNKEDDNNNNASQHEQAEAESEAEQLHTGDTKAEQEEEESDHDDDDDDDELEDTENEGGNSTSAATNSINALALSSFWSLPAHFAPSLTLTRCGYTRTIRLDAFGKDPDPTLAELKDKYYFGVQDAGSIGVQCVLNAYGYMIWAQQEIKQISWGQHLHSHQQQHH